MRERLIIAILLIAPACAGNVPRPPAVGELEVLVNAFHDEAVFYRLDVRANRLEEVALDGYVRGSPDGLWLAQANERGLSIAPATNLEGFRLTVPRVAKEGTIESMVWAQDSSSIAFMTSLTLDEEKEIFDHKLSVVNRDGTGLRMVRRFRDPHTHTLSASTHRAGLCIGFKATGATQCQTR